MEGYKVIKEFGSAKEGDVFTKVDGLEGLWDFQKTIQLDDAETFVSMTFDSSTMNSLEEKGYVVGYESEEECDNCDNCCCNNKLRIVKEFVDESISTYTEDYEELMREYDKGNVQPCVKVEAETVYHNLIKVLNTIKGLLDE